jgi:hypothetical protein
VDRAAAHDAKIANTFEPTGALAAYLHIKRTAERLRRAAEQGRLSDAAAFARARPLGSRVLMVAAIVLPLILLAAVGLGGTLLGWAAPSATARAITAGREVLGALGLPGKSPWLPAARDVAAYWAGRGAADRGVVFAAAADISALLSLAPVPLVVVPFWASSAHSRFASPVPLNPDILRRGRLFGAVVTAGMVLLVWRSAQLLVYGDLNPAMADSSRFSASSFAPAWSALIAVCGPLFAAGLPIAIVEYVIRLPAR